jgi:crotonobetainyl-CoA:carnitine CoA-transferase CaiB-like acyl-CoA transferase
LAGLHAAFGLLVALDNRDRTGQGGLVEIAMVEGALNAASEQIVEWSCYGREMQREGNRSPYAAPQGLYACPGWEQWLAVSCETDEHWEALCTALDRPDWRAAERFRTFAARRAHHDELDAELRAWASTHPLDDAVEWLVGCGVPAAPARDPRLYSAHPQTTSRGFHEEVDHPIAGVQPLPRPPFTYSGIETWIRRRAPLLGEHNHEVLGEAGYTAAEIDQLERLGVTGTRPAGV